MYDLTFNSTITLYNKYTRVMEGRSQTYWKRTVIRNVSYRVKKVEDLSGNVLSQANSYSCKIQKSQDYTPYKQFLSLSDNLIGNAFTLNTGDIIVFGEVLDEIEDVQSKRVSDLLQKYKPDCFTIKTVSINTNIPQSSHYAVTGV